MAGSPLLSIAICTHNRADLAIECLTGILSQLDCHSVRVLVIDNSSLEAGALELQEWCSNRQPLVYLRETQPGLSRARNLAVEHAETEWIAFLDDDAMLRVGWLAAVMSFVAAAECSIAAFGGPVFPRWPSLKDRHTVHPQRLGRLWCEFLSLTDPSALADGITPRILGCNMVLRTSVVRELGGFTETLGRTPTSLRGGEEIDLLRRMAKKHYGIGFETSASVEHVIHRERLTRAWIKRRVLDEGRVSAQFRTDVTFVTQQVLALPPLAASAFLISCLKTSQVNSHDNYVRFWRNWGYVVGLLCNTYRRVLRKPGSNQKRHSREPCPER
jgi:glycosyltransferase involved in cell wall biosynthesis